MANELSSKVKLWGEVKDKQGVRVQGVCVRLVKKNKRKKRMAYQMLQEGWTDQNGIYTFEIDRAQLGQYKIIVIDQRKEEGAMQDVSQ